MDRKNVSRSIRRSIIRRERRDEFYKDRRLYFEVQSHYSGWFKKKLEGWVVVALRVEGSSCAAPMGSFGYIVEDDISPLFPTKFGAYRWIVENIVDDEDIDHYIY